MARGLTALISDPSSWEVLPTGWGVCAQTWPAVGLLRGHGGDVGSQICEHPPPTPQLQVRPPYGCLNPLMDP